MSNECHDDSACGSCGGPLEVDRDAICERCAPSSMWWDATQTPHRWGVLMLLLDKSDIFFFTNLRPTGSRK